MAPTLSIIIATAGRRDSLLETLRALDPGSMPDEAEVVVVDNAPEPELDGGELADIGAGRVRLLHEPRPGKYRCLNAAINAAIDSGLGEGLGEGWMGETIAVLDDDMTPMPGWAAAVVRSVEDHPEHDLFAGKSHVVWPEGLAVPPWAGHFLAQGVCFSVLTWDGPGEREMGGNFPTPSGNHFWFRRRVLGSVPAFPPGWTSELRFCLEARARGHRGVLLPSITCGHRVQPGLMDPRAFLERALTVGRTLGSAARDEQRLRSGGRAHALASRGRSAAALTVWAMREQRARARARGEADPPPEIVIARARARLQRGRYEGLLGLRSRIGDAP